MIKKITTVLLVLTIALASVFAAQFLTVPLDSEAYRIIEVAELKGIIPKQSDVRPYNASLVISLLNTIRSADSLSSKEVAVVDNVLSTLNEYYGNEENKDGQSIIGKGFFRTSANGSSATLGVRIHSNQIAGLKLDSDKIFDSQNGGTFYFNGDLFDTLSYNVNISAMFDKRDEDAYLPNDFTLFADGNYFSGNGTGGNGSKVWGMAADPEISASFFNDKVYVRFGAFDRDWGEGNENFAISKSASEFDAFEFYMKPADWIEFASLQGSFAKFSYGENATTYGVQWLSDEYHSNLYNNNYSLHRVTLNLNKWQLSAYESVVWRKRNELSYYNPFAIYMFVQNQVSDYDSMLCGVDFSFVDKHSIKYYGAVGMSEFNSLSLKTFFSHARHVLSFQGGVEMPIPVGSFGKFNFQLTYLPPFWGTHYTWSSINPNNPYGDYSTTFVNKGRTFSYPLYPDSLELKINLETNYNASTKICFTLKDQLRSAQYALDNVNGTTYSTVMDYEIEANEGYEDKAFRKYIWRNTLLVSADIVKKLDNLPVEITFGLQGIADWKRDYDVTTNYRKIDDRIPTSGYNAEINEWNEKYNLNNYYNRGGADMGDWKLPEVSAMVKVGVKIYY